MEMEDHLAVGTLNDNVVSIRIELLSADPNTSSTISNEVLGIRSQIVT